MPRHASSTGSCALFGRDAVHVELIDHGNPLDTRDNDVLAGLAAERGLPLLATQQRALRRAAARSCSPRRSPPCARTAGSTSSTGGCPPHAGAHLRSGAEMAERFVRLPGCRRPHRRRSPTSSPSRCGAPSPRCRSRRCPRGTRRCRGCGTWCGRRCRASTPTSPTTTATRIEKELGVIELKDFPGYFLIVYGIVQEARRRGILCQGRGSAANSADLLPARHHRRRRDRLRAAVRAVPLVAARRGARHRRRLRLRPPRGDHPVGLRAVRARARGAGRERHPVPAEERRARHGEGARALARAAGCLVEAGGAVGRDALDRAGARHPRSGDRVRVRAAEGAAASRHPLRRHGAHRPARRRGRADRARAHGEPHGDPVGQGRRRLDGAREVRPARARDAGRPAVLLRHDPRRDGGGVGARDDPEGGEGGLRHAVPGGLDRGVPGRVARADGAAAAPAAAAVLRPRDRDRPHPPGSDPGRRGASVRAAQARLRAGHLRRTRSSSRCSSARSASRSSRSSSCRWRWRWGSARGRMPISCAARWAPSAGSSGSSRCARSSTRGWRRTTWSGEDADAIYAKIQAFANFGFAESHSLSFALLVYASSWIKLHYPGGVPRGAAARAADGVLLAGVARGGCPPPRRRGAPARPARARASRRCSSRWPPSSRRTEPSEIAAIRGRFGAQTVLDRRISCSRPVDADGHGLLHPPHPAAGRRRSTCTRPTSPPTTAVTAASRCGSASPR